MIAIYACVCLVQIYSRTYDLSSKIPAISGPFWKSQYMHKTKKKENSHQIHPGHFHTRDFPSVGKEEGHFGKDKW